MRTPSLLAALALATRCLLLIGCGGDPAETGTGGSGGGGGPPASVDGAPECGPVESQLAGTVAGDDLATTFLADGVGLSGGVQIYFGDYGALYLDPKDGDALGVVHPVTGFARLPEDSPQPGEWYCAGPDSALLLDDDLTTVKVVLRSLSTLSPCPGEPVSGEMEVCFPGLDCIPGVKSTVPGASFDIPFNGLAGASGQVGSSELEAIGTLAGNGGFVMLQATTIDTSSTDVQTSLLGIGSVTIPEGKPDAGAVYCIGEGSTMDYLMMGPYPTPLHATLKGLSRLGTCPAKEASGELGFCMNQNE